MKKIIFLLFACFACMQTTSAQDYYESSSDIYGLGNTSYQKKWNKSVHFAIAKQVEAGLTFRRDFGPYFAWDVYGFSYAYDYKSCDNVNHECKIARTGLRGFSPTFGKAKIYTALGFGFEMINYVGTEVYFRQRYVNYGYGYGYGYYETDYYTEEVNNWSPAMCIDFQLGIYLTKTLSVGYQINSHKLGDGNSDHLDHMIRVAIDF